MRSTLSNRILLILFLAVLAASLLYLTAVIVRIPTIGAVLSKEPDNRYIVKSIEPAGQAELKGIRVGDQILEVNDRPVDEFQNVLKYNSIEYADHVLVLHKDKVQQLISFPKGWSGEHSVWELMIQLYIPGISLVIFCAFSGFLYAKRRNDKAAIMLILFFISIGISYYSSAASYRRDPIGISVIYAVLPNIPLLFMSFMNNYLQRFDVHFISKKALRVLFGLVGLVSIVSLLYIWTNLFSIKMYNYVQAAFSGVVLLGNLICAYKLIRKFIKHRHTKMHSLFTITLISHLVAFTPFATMNLLPQIFGERQILPAAFTALFLFVLPIVYFYLSTSNQLFDIDFILTRFKYYTALALIPSILIAALVAFVVLGENNPSWSVWFGIFIVIYIGMTLFLYVKEQIDQRFRPKLFKAMYSYQDSLDRFSRKIARVMKQADLEDVLKQEITELLPVNRITFLVVEQSENIVFPIGEQPEELITAEFLLGTVSSLQLGELIELPYGLGLVIGRQRSRYHILWIGMKTNHTRFNSDELRWLKTMSNYASIVFENLYLIEGLIEDLESEVRKEHSTSPWVLRLLFCLSENERRKLAADLHDSALQDQLLWYRKLEAVMMDHPISTKLGHELEDIKEGLLDVIHQIRETCNELRPPLLKEMGVVEAVESIIEHTQMRVNFAVDFHAKAFSVELNEEQITAIYRIVQELLRNADKHSQAKLVTLELEQRNDMIYFRYQDDGIGMDVNHMIASFEHMGLSGIKERVTGLEGDISFYSQRGNGLEVVIMLPEMMTTGRSERGISRDSYLIS
ncbi:ATP-binding protein [Paenibacillus prosopidis]|uniref:histidine kinase n=1 Tax=Paenibacillus prosopidis TaxID=630520 RepID=A0A368VSZ3_9BACL|nr:ATP-binding protein [Paenibacillus prosopidis]RCW44294.1 two-component system sensor histidine kinase ComP [Paenibacillus prosopidis]